MIYYRELILDRASEARKDPDWVIKQWTRRSCRVFVLRHDKSLMRWPDRERDRPEAVQVARTELESLTESGDFAVAVVVPALELATADVYRRWDSLGEPSGPPIPGSNVPPGLRSLGPLQNDLWPAALDLSPEMGEWRSALESTWGTTVAMTGSGSALFGFFPTKDEADGAVQAADVPFRARRAVVPVAHGAILDHRYTSERP